MRLKIITRKDGTIRLEVIGNTIDWDESHDMQVGDEGCFATVEDVSPDVLRTGEVQYLNAFMRNDDEGISGNLNQAIKCLHGWRGTTDDRYVKAWGWRRVLSAEKRKRGIGYVFILSEDLRPDEQ